MKPENCEIYLDNNATTRAHPEVVRAMIPYLETHYGNPSSIWHAVGRRAREAVEHARSRVANLVGCESNEVIFTSGGSESNTQALMGVLRSEKSEPQIVTSPIEHDSVRRTASLLELGGGKVHRIPVDERGVIRLEALHRALSQETNLVSIMWVNNETGVIQPIEKVAALTSTHGVPLHVDAVQAIGRLDVDLSTVEIDLMTLSSHKIRGPKGVGALILRNRRWGKPLILGGHQERGMRAGTENVAGIVGFGVACERLKTSWQDMRARSQKLRTYFESQLLEASPDAVIFGATAPRVCNTTLIAWPNLDSADLLKDLDRANILAASGSACTSTNSEPSHVLTAMGAGARLANNAVRFSLGSETTSRDIDTALEIINRLATDRFDSR